MTAEATFTSPEGMQQGYSQMWEDIASGIGYVPQYFEDSIQFASDNPVALLVEGLFLVLVASFFIRKLITVFSGRNR